METIPPPLPISMLSLFCIRYFAIRAISLIFRTIALQSLTFINKCECCCCVWIDRYMEQHAISTIVVVSSLLYGFSGGGGVCVSI